VSQAGYFRYITFEKPGHLFTYAANKENELPSDEVQELIKKITIFVTIQLFGRSFKRQSKAVNLPKWGSKSFPCGLTSGDQIQVLK
jgi:hypothetical protein